MPDSPLTRKIGPLPAWGWLAAVTLGIILYYRHSQNAAASSSTGTVYDPNAVDPTTGLTYGQEAQLALGGSGAPGGGQLTPTTGAGTDTTSTSSGGPSWTDIVGGWSDIAGAWRDIATTQLTPPTNTVIQVPTDPKPPKTGAGKGKVWAWIGGKWEAIKNPNAKPPGKGKGKPPGGHPGVGSAGKGKGGKSGGAKASSNNRAPASSRENVHAQAQAHTTPPPARTRVTVRRPPPAHHNRPPARRR